MWSAGVEIAGWAVLYLLLLFFVRWIAIERTFFAGQDPERWKPESLSEAPSADQEELQLGARRPFGSLAGDAA